MTRILFTEPAYDHVRPKLGALAQQLSCAVMDNTGTVRIDGREVPADAVDAECAFISVDLFASRVQTQFIDALMKSPALKWVQSCGAGRDHQMFVTLAQKDIRLTTNHSQAVGMADYVMWGVLNHFQRGAAIAAAQAAHKWTKRSAREISGTRWLIIGFGAIGEAVARRAKGFDAHVTGIRRKPGASPVADAMAAPDQVIGLLRETDVVVLSMPHTPQTENMADATFLAAMKPGSILVNVGRGSAIDDAALLTALDSGKPEHAVLDVFRVEPLPADHPFWAHPRVTVTAHTSAASANLAARTDQLLLDNLARYLAGQPLLNEVDR